MRNPRRSAGVTIALDDFGTGYATLTQLMSLHFDKIKIDRSFVQRLGKDSESLVVVRAIVGLAKGFGLTTVGEGVEEEDQRAHVWRTTAALKVRDICSARRFLRRRLRLCSAASQEKRRRP
jgi:EAL domain-containing protein (putative c-di-GMP-specific phosphodiesterase class I)